MKKILSFMLALALLCICLNVPAEGNETAAPELDAAKLPVFEANDPCLEGLAEAAGEALPVLLLPLGRTLQLAVRPGSAQGTRIILSVDKEDVVRVRGNTVTGLQAGEAVLTVAGREDASASARYRVIVIEPVTRITLTAAEQKVAVGQTVSLAAEFLPENAALKSVTWSSSDEQTATVDGQGNVTGVKRGGVRITAAAKDGSNTRASITLQVVQNAGEITLDRTELTVDTGKAVTLKATVLPVNTNDKELVWTSSDEGIAKVNAQGRVTGVAPGDCEITCAGKAAGDVQAKATVHVQQPVSRITFGEAPAVYVGETSKLAWNTEPANASNPAVKLTSGDESILTVSDDGTVTGVAPGTATVTAVTTDGSNRRAQIRIRVTQHVQSVRMRRNTAYIDKGESATASAVMEPDKGVNKNMTWESADPSVATVKAVEGQPGKVMIKGVAEGETTITGTTEDGGYQASMTVKVGSWSRAVKIKKVRVNSKGKVLISVKNVSKGMHLTMIKATVEAYDKNGKPVTINKKDKSNVVNAYYYKTLNPGRTTKEDEWVLQDFKKGAEFSRMTVRVVAYQISGDWMKMLRKYLQPKYEYKAGK